ncbi:MAG TPA: hypothetical protein PKG77_24510 [Phycisphaerae bacterium]|mgnify:CR=1 FL=1|nr:hypothetical protein [Phycisphaerae bacterium]
MNCIASLLDPGTPDGAVFSQVLAGILLLAIVAVLGWVLGPLKWLCSNRRLKRFIECHQFMFVFNPDNPEQKSKVMTFLTNGDIGEGRNNNEYIWHMRRGCLEILGSDGVLYSRFRLDLSTGRMTHTNDADTRSIRRQYFEVIPQRVPRPKPGNGTGGVAADGQTDRLSRGG